MVKVIAISCHKWYIFYVIGVFLSSLLNQRKTWEASKPWGKKSPSKGNPFGWQRDGFLTAKGLRELMKA
jgi:hypothetical protein